jgi:mono/diheme cytochrome c family protein
LTLRVRITLVLSLTVALAVPAAHGLAARDTTAAPGAKILLDPVKLEAGRKLYRKYCGQCHALKAARAVGFGQDKLSTDPGPAFNSLRVPYNLSVLAIVLSISGHETIQDKMTWKEIFDVSRYLDQVTRGNPILATLTGANFSR